MNKLNKFLVFSLMLVTAFSMSFGGVVKVRAEGSFEAGTLIAQEGVEGAAVYYVGSDGKKYVYPDHFTYLTWYENWDGIERVSVSVLDEYENGGAITYRPGTKLVTTQDTAVVYALEAGGTLRSVVDEDTVVALYGADWGSLLTDVDTATFASFYSAGDPLDAMLPSGTLVSFEETDYYVDGNDLRPFADMDAFDANNFNSEFILVVDSIDSYGTGESITGAESALYEFTPVTGGSSDDSGDEASAGELSVSLASNTAVAATIISDTADSSQALIPFVSVNFTAPDTGDVTVTNVKFERTGISADTDINNSYLYDGVTRLAEGGSVSSGVVTFNDSTGLFVVSAGTTKTIDFKIDLLYNTSAGKTMEFGLSEVTTSNDATINGDLPLVGNTMTTASIADLGNVTITNGTTPASDTTVDPGETDYEIYKITLAANDQDMQLEYFKLTLIGSAAAADFENINLTKGGVVLATSSIDDNRELVFDLSSDPYVIEKGQAPSFSVRADIVSGSTRDFKFSTEYSSDLVLKDNNYDVYVTPFGSSAWTAKKAASGTEFSINSGSLAVSLDTSSPTENVASDATNVKLATFKFEATGEDVKVSNLDINAGTASGIEGGLNNGKILLDGIQVGTTKDLTEATDVNFTFGSSFIVPAGEFKLVDVYADIKTTTSTAITAGTITITLGAGNSNAQGIASLTSLTVPSSDTAATALTVSTGSLALIKYTAYGDQNVVKPATQAHVGSFVVSSGAYEGVSVDTVNISQATSGVMQNMKLFDGSTQVGSTKTTLTGTSATENVFSLSDLVLAANESKVIDVYADIKSSTGATSIAIVVDLAGTTDNTSTAVTATDVTMQTMTITTGSIASSADGSQPNSAVLLAGTTAIMNAVKFTASNEAFTVTKLQISEPTAGAYDATGKVVLEYTNEAGDLVTKEGYLDGSGDVSFTGLDMWVPKDETAVLTVKSEIPTIAAGVDSGDLPQLDFDYDATTFSALGELSNTVVTTGPTDVNGNPMVIRKTVATITNVALPSTVLNDGTQTIAKFSVAADAAGDVYFQELNWTYATSTGVDITDGTIFMYKESDQSTALNSADSLPTDDSMVFEIIMTTEQVVAAGTSVTYVVKGTVSGSADNKSFSTNLKSSASAATAGTSTTYADLKTYETGGIVWSDGSATPHSSTSADYADCTYMKNLPADSQTLSR